MLCCWTRLHNLNYREDSTKQEILDVTLSNTGLILKDEHIQKPGICYKTKQTPFHRLWENERRALTCSSGALK